MIKQMYLGVESLSLTTPQKQTLVTALQQLGPNNHPQPSHRNHWRFRLDDNAVILEAEFDDQYLTVLAFRQRLAAIFGIPLAQVTAAAPQTGVYGVMSTFSYQATPYLRIIVFGGADATYAESHAAALAYLAANIADWEPA